MICTGERGDKKTDKKYLIQGTRDKK